MFRFRSSTRIIEGLLETVREQEVEIKRLTNQIIEMKGFEPLDREIEPAYVGYMDDAKAIEVEMGGHDET